MKKFLANILAFLVLFSSMVAFADEIQVVIDTEVPVFDDLVDGKVYTRRKDIKIADLSKVSYALMIKNSGKTAKFEGKTFSGYAIQSTEKDVSCIEYKLIETVTKNGNYMIYAVDEQGHDIAVRFTIRIPDENKNVSSGGGGGGGGYRPSIPDTPVTPVAPVTPEVGDEPEDAVTESLVKDKLETENHIVYMNGYLDGTFRPDDSMTRAEVATMFARLMREKMDVGSIYNPSFEDVAAGEWYYNYIGYIEKFGIINGYEDGTFRPDATITRAEFVTIASRFAELNGSYSCDFEDVDEAHWAYNYIAFAASNNWVGGYYDNTFRADNTITRGEVVTIVNNMLVRNADRDFVLDNFTILITFKDVAQSHWAFYEVVEATNEHDFTLTDGNEKWN